MLRLINRSYCVKSDPIIWNHEDFGVKRPLFWFHSLWRLVKCLKKDPLPMKFRMMICTQPVKLWYYRDIGLKIIYEIIFRFRIWPLPICFCIDIMRDLGRAIMYQWERPLGQHMNLSKRKLWSVVCCETLLSLQHTI